MNSSYFSLDLKV